MLSQKFIDICWVVKEFIFLSEASSKGIWIGYDSFNVRVVNFKSFIEPETRMYGVSYFSFCSVFACLLSSKIPFVSFTISSRNLTYSRTVFWARISPLVLFFKSMVLNMLWQIRFCGKIECSLGNTGFSDWSHKCGIALSVLSLMFVVYMFLLCS